MQKVFKWGVTIILILISVVAATYIIAPLFGDVSESLIALTPIEIGEIEDSTSSNNWHIDLRRQLCGELDAQSISKFQSGLASAVINSRHYLINESGEQILDRNFKDCVGFDGDLIVVAGDSGYYYIDPDAKPILDTKYEYAEPFQDGIARVKLDGLWNVIDSDGELLLDEAYYQLDEFSEGYALARTPNHRDIIDLQGSVYQLPVGYDANESFNDGVALVTSNTGEIGTYFLDLNGNVTGQGQYHTFSYADGLAITYEGVEPKYINIQGEVVIEDGFNAASKFYSGYSFVRQAGNPYYYLIDTQGNPVQQSLEWEATDVVGFVDDLAWIEQNGSWRLLRKSGDTFTVGETGYAQVNPFSQGVAEVVKDGKTLLLAADEQPLCP